MADADTTAELRLERTFDAPPDVVFDAWTDPEVLERWFAVDPDWDTPEADVDLRRGGRYPVPMRAPASGAEHTVEGEYGEVDRPSRLTYTWSWVDNPMDTFVTVEFQARGDATNVVLTHTDLPGEESRAQHEHGWNACLDNLDERVVLD